MSSVLKKLRDLKQDQILKFFNELSEDDQASFQSEIDDIDWDDLQKAIVENLSSRVGSDRKLKSVSKIDDDLIRELPEGCIEGKTRCDQDKLDQYRTIGLDNIKKGKVACLLLAGGQGTRLGVNYPKGMYDVGLPTHKSLFQLQAERILDLAKSQEARILWYIMTSEATMEQTKSFFRDHSFFGIAEDRLVFFEQNTVPCLDLDGKVLLNQKGKISRSPNGNGGIFEALHDKGVLDHMVENGVDHLHVYCVDNILVRVCDPVFVGFCISKQADAGAKVIEKLLPNESLGTICKVNDRFKVIEYSEISEAVAAKRNPSNGKLVFNAGNICDQYFRVDFLSTIKKDRALPYHIALKKIPYIDLQTGNRVEPTEPNGIKLEKFIFDVFEFTDKLVVWEVLRENEFSPIKNGPGTEKDNPTTARQALIRAHELGLFLL